MDELIALLTTRRTIPQWLHRWREPGVPLTPIEVIARWCAEQLEPRTLREWGAELGPKLRSPMDPAEVADTAPLNMLEAALIAAISANDRAVESGRNLDLLYQHARIGATYDAAVDPRYPRSEDQVRELAAFVRGEAGPPAYLVEAARALEDGRG